MIYVRKLLDMFILSMVPSLISFMMMSRYMNYITWFVGGLLSTIVFFVGNGLLIRRFVRDIRSKNTYYRVWLITFVAYVAGGALCLAQDWMYPFTWIFFHTRVISIITMTTIGVPVWASFTISSLAFLALILIERPIAAKCYEKEVAQTEAKEIEARRLARAAQKMYELERKKSEEKRKTAAENISKRDVVQQESNNMRYSVRQLKKMEKINAAEAKRKRQIGAQRAMGRKMMNNISGFILNLGSYAFYQFLADKVAQGNNPGPIIISYLRRRLNIGIRAPRNR